MKCRAVRQRMVAFRDRELSPEQGARVREHLARCLPCRIEDRRLLEATPATDLVIPVAVVQRLQARINGPVLRSLADAEPGHVPHGAGKSAVIALRPRRCRREVG